MFESLLFHLVFLLLMTTTIVISEYHDENHYDETQLKTNITCLCSEDEECDGDTRTCQLSHPLHTCYESWTLQANDGSVHVTAGCMYNDYFFVKLMCGVNQTNRYIICCSQRDYCNDLDEYSKEIRQSLLASIITSSNSRPDSSLMLILIIIISTIVAILLLMGGTFVYIKQNHLKKPKPTCSDYDEHQNKTLFQRLFHLIPYKKPSQSNSQQIIPNDQSSKGLLDDFSSSTMGPALPLLMQRTLARQITLEHLIGTGRYGSVHRGKWREDYVAVKIFSANDERSWFREIDIYQTVCLRHENILGYIAADIMDASTHTQLLLVTEYHENGSIYDYLMNHTISVPILLKMMLSIASGLCHLHMPIDSTNGKVALAHRDLKTKNILVKKDLSCCIADLGLAVKEVRNRTKIQQDDDIVIDIQENNRVGTIRYMAPEVLNGTLNRRSFESFKSADIYALGLCYWEILRRCRLNPNENDADSYQVPYEDITPNNPTFEQMKEVVCTQKHRPPTSARWLNHPVLRSMVKMCEELWNEDPSCRLTSLNIKRQLKQLETLLNGLSNINIELQQQQTQNNGPWTA